VNTADVAQPVGLGWHPYFPKRARSRLHIELSDRWDADASQLPVRKVAQPGIDSDVSHLDYDNCFEGWRGPARIRDEKFSLQLSSSLPYLVVFTPTDRDYFCVEPVSHVSNAIHMADPAAHGLRSLAPGESLEASMKLDVAVV
jgi:aldose 1-epimerase